MTTSFITTAIPYVNARPHLGFAYELVLGDVLARHHRQRGRDVRFSTGTDDHSLKNVVAAAREGIATRELVDRNGAAFRELGALLHIATDDFIHTSSDSRHRAGVEWLWRACAARGDFERRAWQGRYCAGCEAFVEDDVAICPEHGVAPEPVSEDNWFFKLSKWREPVRDAIVSGRLAIAPDAARAETLAFLDGDVRDLSVSRVATRSNGWGIPVPGDPTQVIYVWFDALASYLTSLGLGGDEALLDRYWRGTGQRTHVIGKGITRFHAVYWPAFLLSAGLPLPDRILVHGYVTVDGEKISKSGRTVEVASVVGEVNADALRWYFARCCRTRADSDISIEAVCNAYNADLADGLGNLVQRCAALADGSIPSPIDTVESTWLRARSAALPARVDAAIDAFEIDRAAAAIVELIDDANRYLERVAPWRLRRTDPAAAAAALHAPLEAARVAAGELSAFVPDVARTIIDRVGDVVPGAPIARGAPPLPRITAGSTTSNRRTTSPSRS